MIGNIIALDLDDPLLEVSCEVYAINKYHKFIEEQIENLQQMYKDRLEAHLKTHRLTADDPEWHEAIDEYYSWVDFLFPRFFRGPFIVSLYALYESIVLEVATLIRASNPKYQSINSFKKKNIYSDFLEQMQNYYKIILRIEICPDSFTWERLVIISKLRNALAHANGRIDSLKPLTMQHKIIKISHDIEGIDINSGYLIFSRDFVDQSTQIVLGELHRFIDEHRQKCR